MGHLPADKIQAIQGIMNFLFLQIVISSRIGMDIRIPFLLGKRTVPDITGNGFYHTGKVSIAVFINVAAIFFQHDITLLRRQHFDNPLIIFRIIAAAAQ